jgi:hypothetical protein
MFSCSLFLFGQDTIIDIQGLVRYGSVLEVDKTRRYIVFEENNTRSIISMEILQSFTKNSYDSSFQRKDYMIKNAQNPSNDIKKMGVTREFMPKGFGKYSVGLNFMALSNPDRLGRLDFLNRTYTTNRFLDLFFQVERSPKLAFRFPLRIGLNPLSEEVTFLNGDPKFYWRDQYMKELVGDVGFEPLFYFLGIHKMTWFFSPGIGMGIGRKVQLEKYNVPSEDIAAIFTPMGNTFFMRYNINLGFQYFLSDRIQLEMTSGFLLSKNYRISGWDLRNSRYISRTLRVALVYRFDK